MLAREGKRSRAPPTVAAASGPPVRMLCSEPERQPEGGGGAMPADAPAADGAAPPAEGQGDSPSSDSPRCLQKGLHTVMAGIRQGADHKQLQAGMSQGRAAHHSQAGATGPSWGAACRERALQAPRGGLKPCGTYATQLHAGMQAGVSAPEALAGLLEVHSLEVGAVQHSGAQVPLACGTQREGGGVMPCRARKA